MNSKNTIIKYIKNFYWKNYGSDITIKNLEILIDTENKLKVNFDYYDPEFIKGDDDYRIGNFNIWDSPKDDADEDDVLLNDTLEFIIEGM